MSSIRNTYTIKNVEDVINLLQSVDMIVSGGMLQPEDIMETGAFNVEVHPNYFNALKSFDIKSIEDGGINGCVPIFIKESNNCKLVWVYGYEVKFGLLKICTSGGAISKDELLSSDLRIACDLEVLAERYRRR